MRIRTRITQVARERGLTAAEVARRLQLYPSNLSAMDAGTRSVSLKALTRVARFLNCSPADLLEVTWAAERPIFRDRKLKLRLEQRQQSLLDHPERGWVNAAMLAWQRHYGTHRRGGVRGRKVRG